MLNLSGTFRDEQCIFKCNEIENTHHLYICPKINEENHKQNSYSEFYRGNLQQKLEIYSILKGKLKKRYDLAENMNMHIDKSGSKRKR